jgi:hypothetical protein
VWHRVRSAETVPGSPNDGNSYSARRVNRPYVCIASGFFVKQPKASCVEGDFEALLVRMRQRRYPETIPVLASYWLRTVYASGYGRRHWKKLNRLLKRAVGEHLPGAPRQAIVDIQTWIQQSALPTAGPPAWKWSLISKESLSRSNRQRASAR